MKKLSDFVVEKLLPGLMTFHRDPVLPTIGASCIDVRANR